MTRNAKFKALPPLLGLIAAVFLAFGASLAPPLISPVDAARPDLTLVADARYDVQPDRKRVADVWRDLQQRVLDLVEHAAAFSRSVRAWRDCA